MLIVDLNKSLNRLKVETKNYLQSLVDRYRIRPQKISPGKNSHGIKPRTRGRADEVPCHKYSYNSES